MTQVDFHFNTPDKLHYVCRLLRKIYNSGKKSVVYCADTELMSRLDQQLWSFSQLDFLPHVRASDPLSEVTPIILLSESAQTPHHEVLVNLAQEMPPFFSRYDRLVEVVSLEDDDRQQARLRWKFYKDRGYPMNTYDLAKVAG